MRPSNPLASAGWLAWSAGARGYNESSPYEKAILYLGFQEAGQLVVMLSIHDAVEGSVFLFLG